MNQPSGAEVTQSYAYKPFTVPSINASGPLQPSGEQLLGGWSFIEDTGAAAAAIQLVDGGVSGGSVVAEIVLAAGAAETRCAPGAGIWIRSGLSVVVRAGAVRGSVWIAQR